MHKSLQQIATDIIRNKNTYFYPKRITDRRIEVCFGLDFDDLNIELKRKKQYRGHQDIRNEILEVIEDMPHIISARTLFKVKKAMPVEDGTILILTNHCAVKARAVGLPNEDYTIKDVSVGSISIHSEKDSFFVSTTSGSVAVRAKNPSHNMGIGKLVLAEAEIIVARDQLVELLL